MSISIRVALGDRESREAFALRYRTFVGEGILDRHRNDALLFDVFDALPSSYLFVAVKQSKIVGTVRTTFHSDLPAPTDDFGLPAGTFPPDAIIGSGSMLCVDPDFRNGTLGLRLVRSAMHFQYERGTTHAMAAIRPEAVPIFERLGWLQIARAYYHAVENVPVVPMGLELGLYFDPQGRRDLATSEPASLQTIA